MMDLFRPPCPVYLLKQGHLEDVGQDHVQTAFKCVQGLRFHNISGQPVSRLSHSHRKKMFLHSLMNNPSGFTAKASLHV